MRSLGILGGTFDPIHYGHLAVAKAVVEEKLADTVILMPAGKPPHKQAQASSQDRLAMTMLAAYGMDNVEVSPLEATALGVAYTADTLERLSELYKGDRLYLVLGSDALDKVPRWKKLDVVKAHCDGIIAAPRFDGERKTSVAGIPVRYLDMDRVDIAASRVREQAGADVSDLTPVEDYIHQHGLYGAGECETTSSLRASMSVSRFQHTLSVATTAVCLAYVHGVDPRKAHLAGLLHDCAKGMSAEEQLRWIREGHIETDEEELQIASICHAPAGAAVARSVYGVEDGEVLSAIRWHTTGRRGMTELDKVVYLADMIEPLRKPFPGLTRIRQMAYRDLNGAVMTAARLSTDRILSGGWKQHGRTLEMLEEAGKE